MARKVDNPKARAVLVVTYDDGNVETVHPNRPALLLALEREYGVPEPQKMEHIAWLAWHALGRPDADLDTWLDRVDLIDAQRAPGKGQPS